MTAELSNYLDTKMTVVSLCQPSPSLFDFQVNGFAGVDFQRDELCRAALRQALEGLSRHGTRRFFLTLITDEIDRLARRLEQVEGHRLADPMAAAMIAGYHLEGPWLSPKLGYRGAHPEGPMRAPSFADFKRLQAAAGGNIRLVTLAPEWPGAEECIAAMVATGVNVALGHTEADDGSIDRAIAAGARFCTHLGNGTPAFIPRHDNVVQRLLARDELIACFIPDGVHLPPFVLKNFVRAKPAGRVLFTTDAMAGAGVGPGRYSLGTSLIEVGEDGVARQPGGEGFAGSTLTPAQGMANVAKWLDLSPETARRLWSEDACAAFGLPPVAEPSLCFSHA
jgi:N-acetylglucosamine-6-phosphate deacetylase